MQTWYAKTKINSAFLGWSKKFSIWRIKAPVIPPLTEGYFFQVANQLCHMKRQIDANLFYIFYCQNMLSSTLFMWLTYPQILFSSNFYFFEKQLLHLKNVCYIAQDNDKLDFVLLLKLTRHVIDT